MLLGLLLALFTSRPAGMRLTTRLLISPLDLRDRRVANTITVRSHDRPARPALACLLILRSDPCVRTVVVFTGVTSCATTIAPTTS